MANSFHKSCISLGIAALLLGLTYSIFLSFQARRLAIQAQISASQQMLQQQSKILDGLDKALHTVRDLLTTEPDAESHRKIIEKIAQQHHLFNLDYSSLPQEQVFQEANFSMTKTVIRLTFSVKNDDSLWFFLRDLHEFLPRTLFSQFLLVEKVVQKNGLSLKGSYHFECYRFHITSSSKGPIDQKKWDP